MTVNLRGQKTFSQVRIDTMINICLVSVILLLSLSNDVFGQTSQLREEATRQRQRPMPQESIDSKAEQKSQELEIRIGHAGPLSGTIAHLGRDNLAGAQLAIADLNKARIKIGGRTARFVLISEDDGADPQRGVGAAQRLAKAQVVGVVGHLNSGTTIPAAKIYRDAGIPQISPSATNPRYTRLGFPTAFRMVANDAALGALLAKFAIKDLQGRNIQRVVVIDDRTAYGAGLADEFIQSLRSLGGAIIERHFTTDTATEFSSILGALRVSRPDIVFFGGMDSVGGPLLNQMYRSGINATFIGGDGICTGELIPLAGLGLRDNQIFCAEAGGVVGEAEKRLSNFMSHFKRQLGTDVLLYAPYVYDAVMVLVEAMRAADSSRPAEFLPFLKKISYSGVTGVIAFDQFGDPKDPSITLFTYSNRQRRAVKVMQ